MTEPHNDRSAATEHVVWSRANLINLMTAVSKSHLDLTEHELFVRIADTMIKHLTAPAQPADVLSLIASARYAEPVGTAENAWNDALDHIEEGLAAQPPAAPVEMEVEGELVVTQYELAAAKTSLREIATIGSKITDPHNIYGLQMTNISLAALAGKLPDAHPSAGSEPAKVDEMLQAARLHLLSNRCLDADRLIARAQAALTAAPPQPPRMARPAAFLAWAVEMFGPVAKLRSERLMRFIKEAIELAHADNMELETLHAIIRRVYSRPHGIVEKEIGQAQACLETYAEIFGVSSEAMAEAEWQRVQKIPRDEWQRRHAAKQKIGIALADPSSTLSRPESK